LAARPLPQAPAHPSPTTGRAPYWAPRMATPPAAKPPKASQKSADSPRQVLDEYVEVGVPQPLVEVLALLDDTQRALQAQAASLAASMLVASPPPSPRPARRRVPSGPCSGRRRQHRDPTERGAERGAERDEPRAAHEAHSELGLSARGTGVRWSVRRGVAISSLGGAAFARMPSQPPRGPAATFHSHLACFARSTEPPRSAS